MAEPRNISRNTIVLYLRMLLTMGVGFYTSRAILQILGIEDFGIYNLVGGVIAILAFVSNTIISSQSRFLSFSIGFEDVEAIKKTFAQCWTSAVIVALMLLVFCETAGLWWMTNKVNIPIAKTDMALWVFHLSVANMFISMLGTPFCALLIAYERMHLYAGISVATPLLTLLFVILLQQGYWNSDLTVVYTSMLLLVSLIAQLLYVGYAKKILKSINFSLNFDKGLHKLLVYSSWDLYGNLAVTVRTSGIAILQNLFFGVAINAAIGIANQVQNVVNQFASNILFASKPRVVKYYAAGNIDQMLNLMIKTTKYSTLLLCIVILPLMVQVDNVLLLWLGITPAYSGAFVKWFLLFIIGANISQGVLMGVHATSKIKKSSLVNGTLYLLVLPLCYFAFQKNVSPTLPYVLNFIFVLIGGFLNSLYFKVEVPQFRIGVFYGRAVFPSLLLSAIVYVILVLIKDLFNNPYVSFVVLVGVSTLLMGILSWLFILEKDVKIKVLIKLKELWNRS